MLIFNILSNLINSGNAGEVLVDKESTIDFFLGNGAIISNEDALRIMDVGKAWLSRIDSDNGEWNSIRNKSMTLLSSIKGKSTDA